MPEAITMRETAYQNEISRQAIVVDPSVYRCDVCHRVLDDCSCGGYDGEGPDEAPPVQLPARWLAEHLTAYCALFDHELLERYIERGGWDAANNRRRAYFWTTRERKTPRWHQHERGRWPIAMALVGKLEVGACFSRHCRAFCVDIDVHQNGPAVDRLDAVRSALGLDGCTGQFVHKTPGGGYHLWVWLDRAVRCTQVREAVLARLTAAGIEVRPGWVEVYPDGARGIRLPCTRGSDWVAHPGMDLDTGEVDRLKFPTKRGVNRRKQLGAYLSEVEVSKISANELIRGSKLNVVIPRSSPSLKTWVTSSLREGGSADLTRLLTEGVSAPGRSYEEVAVVVLHEARQGGSPGEVHARTMAWWDATRGGRSAGAARSWARKRRAVDRDVRRFAVKAVRERKGTTGGGRTVARAERRRLRYRLAGVSDAVLRESAMGAALEVLARHRGQFVRVHCSRWIAWWRGTYKSLHYQRLRDCVARVLGMAKVGSYRPGSWSQGWAVGWREGGIVSDTAGRIVLVVDGGRVCAEVGGRAIWSTGPPWAPDDVWARPSDFGDALA